MRPTLTRFSDVLAALRAPSRPTEPSAADDLALGMESALPALQGLLPLPEAGLPPAVLPAPH